MSQTTTLPVEVRNDARVVPAMNKRLKSRMEFYKAELPPFAPVYDRIFVYPLKDADQPEKMANGLYLAPQTKAAAGAQRGLLVAAGAKAIEQLYGHGIGLGDIVMTARFSPWEREYLSLESKSLHRVLILRASEVMGSDDLRTDYEKGDLWMEMAPDGTVSVCDRESSRLRSDPEENIEVV